LLGALHLHRNNLKGFYRDAQVVRLDERAKFPIQPSQLNLCNTGVKKPKDKQTLTHK